MIRRLQPADLDPAVAVLRHAFASDPALAWLLPDPDHRARVEPELARAYCRYAMEYGVAWCTDDVTGVALRRPPGAEHLDWLGILSSGMAWLPLHLGWDATARLLQAEETTSRWHADLMDQPHWYLWTLAVDPAHQGEGIGGELMRHTFATADAAGLPCYLETTHPRALAIHQAHGFEIARHERIGDTLDVWAMVRPAA